MKNHPGLVRTGKPQKPGRSSGLNPRAALWAIIPVLLMGWGIDRFVVPLFGDQQIPIASPVLSPDAQAALAGVSAFYSLDYTEPEAAWAERMCALVATPDDCLFLQVYFAPAIQATVQQYRIQTTSTVLPLELISTNESSQSRIWSLQVTLAHPWPGMQATGTIFAEVVYDPARQEWRFRRILFEQEAAGDDPSTP